MALKGPPPTSPFRSMESDTSSPSPAQSQNLVTPGTLNGEVGGVSLAGNAGSFIRNQSQEGRSHESDTVSDNASTRPARDNPILQGPTRQRPKYQDYALKYVRQATFRNWPSHLRQTPDVMADAGFFQTGGVDSVRCYFCGIGLRNWDPEDDPWVEHARWSSKCFHVLDKKGQEFINLVQVAVRQQEMQEALEQNPPREGDITEDCPPHQGRPNEVASQSEPSPSSAEKKNPLLSEAAQSVLAMGYLPKIVQKAVDMVLDTKGWKGMTGENIANYIFEMEDSGEWRQEQLMVPKNNPVADIKSLAGKSKSQLEQEMSELKERMSCKICCENRVSIVFLPCGHLVSCAQCSPALKNCPVCRSMVKGTVRVCFT